MISSKIKRVSLICSIIIALLFLSCISSCSKSPSNTRIFSKCVLSPIPKSVKDIKLDQQQYFSGYIYVLRFNISKDDVVLIINSRPFIELEGVTYRLGSLYYERIKDPEIDTQKKLYNNNSVINTPLYWSSEPPEWFKPNDWNNPKIYRYRTKLGKANTYSTKVLIFNEQLGEAYFIEQLARY